MKILLLLLAFALPVNKNPIEYTKVHRIVLREHKRITVGAFKGVETKITRRIEIYEANMFEQIVKTKTIEIGADEFPKIWKFGPYYQFRYCERISHYYYESNDGLSYNPEEINIHRYRARAVYVHLTEDDRSWEKVD